MNRRGLEPFGRQRGVLSREPSLQSLQLSNLTLCQLSALRTPRDDINLTLEVLWAFAILPGESWTSKSLPRSPVGRSPLFYTVYSVGRKKKNKKPASPPPVLASGEKVTGHLLNEGRKQVPRALSRLFRILEFTVLLVNDYTHPQPRDIWGRLTKTSQNPYQALGL